MHTCPICNNTKEVMELRPVKIHNGGVDPEPTDLTAVLFWCPCGTIWSPERQVENCRCLEAVWPWPGNM